MEIVDVFAPIFDEDNHYLILKSGRNAGKSTVIAQKIVHNLFTYEFDIIVTRANYGDLEGSMYTAIMKVIEDEGYGRWVETKKKPLRLINLLNDNIVYFQGIGGSDLSRTRSYETHKETSMVVIEEAQQLQSQDNLDQALATYRRGMDKDIWQIVMAFNPPKQNSHWINNYYRMKEHDIRYTCIWSSWLDIETKLKPMDIEEMLIEKETNPDNYRWLYMGETEGLFGGVYNTFNRSKHLITEVVMKGLIKEIGVHNVIVGIDAAHTIDKTAVIPAIILNNGQTVITDYFYHDPQRDGELSNDRLLPYIQEFLRKWHIRWGIRQNQRIDMIFDSANADLRITASYRMNSRKYRCQSYTLKNVIEMAQIMQNIFSRNVALILDEPIYNYVTQRQTIINPLVTQLESVMWAENGTKLDPKIPNDATDALTYGIAFYYKNPSALNFPKRQNFYERGVD